MSNQQQSQQTQQKAKETSSIRPVGHVYNITDQDITDFLTSYFINVSNITGFHGARALARREGSRDPELKFVAFFKLNGQDILSGIDQVPEYFREQMEMTNLRASEQLMRALNPIINRNYFRLQKVTKDLAGVELDVFRVLGLMLNLNPMRHQLNVASVSKTKKDHFLATVITTERMIKPDGSGADYLTSLAENFSRNN